MCYFCNGFSLASLQHLCIIITTFLYHLYKAFVKELQALCKTIKSMV